MSEIVTRFAPSPTGYLHIGGARTALFNWLFARHHGGKFLLRVEDTDRQRSTQDAIDAILNGLNWLGLNSDDPPIMQSERIEQHVKAAHCLMENGHAYHCYMSSEEIAAEKQAARDEKRRFTSPWRDADDTATPPLGRDPVIRLRAPVEGDTVVDDQVQGKVRFANEHMDDLVLLRSDGTPTYMLAVVVDDHDMGITHIIRGDDHLVNAARQSLIYQGLDWDVPIFAHIPLIHGPDGKKLSKRHGAMAVEAYRDMGYLPEALCNYLLRLGWSHGDQEFFTEEEAIAAFDLDGINKGPSRMDFDKMDHINAHYLRQMDAGELALLVLDAIKREQGFKPSATEAERITRAIPYLVGRASVIPDLVTQTKFLTAIRPLVLLKPARKAVKPDNMQRLAEIRPRLEQQVNWEADALHAEIAAYAEENEIGFGKIGPIIRAAISAGLPSPDLGVALMLLGREEALARMDDLLNQGVS